MRAGLLSLLELSVEITESDYETSEILTCCRELIAEVHFPPIVVDVHSNLRVDAWNEGWDNAAGAEGVGNRSGIRKALLSAIRTLFECGRCKGTRSSEEERKYRREMHVCGYRPNVRIFRNCLKTSYLVRLRLFIMDPQFHTHLS